MTVVTLDREITPGNRDKRLAPWIELANLAGRTNPRPRYEGDETMDATVGRPWTTTQQEEEFLAPLRSFVLEAADTEWFPADRMRREWFSAGRIPGLSEERSGADLLRKLALAVLSTFRFIVAVGSGGYLVFGKPALGIKHVANPAPGRMHDGSARMGGFVSNLSGLPNDAPQSSTAHLVVNDGIFTMVVFNPFEQYFGKAIEGVEVDRVRCCPVCERMFFAKRIDQLGCSNSCNHTLRQRNWRDNQKKYNQKKYNQKRKDKT